MRSLTKMRRFYSIVFLAVLFLVSAAGSSLAYAVTPPDLSGLNVLGTITDPSKDDTRVMDTHNFIFSALPPESDLNFEDNDRSRKSSQTAEKCYFFIPCDGNEAKFISQPSDSVKISALPSINYVKTTRKQE